MTCTRDILFFVHYSRVKQFSHQFECMIDSTTRLFKVEDGKFDVRKILQKAVSDVVKEKIIVPLSKLEESASEAEKVHLFYFFYT